MNSFLAAADVQISEIMLTGKYWQNDLFIEIGGLREVLAKFKYSYM